VNNSSIGVYPNILEVRDRLRQQGYRKWLAFAVATLDVLRREDEVSVRLEMDGRQMISRTPFVFIGNNEYLVEGIRLGARTRLDGGRLHASFSPPVRTRDLPRLLGQALIGRARQEHALETFSAVELFIETFHARQMKVACDGELLELRTPLHFRSWPGSLNVLAPAP
jgi:diacylglycerol kinase family enzyme